MQVVLDGPLRCQNCLAIWPGIDCLDGRLALDACGTCLSVEEVEFGRAFVAMPAGNAIEDPLLTTKVIKPAVSSWLRSGISCQHFGTECG